MFEKKNEVTTNNKTQATENTELVEQKEEVSMGTKLKNFGSKVLATGKKVAPWVLGAAGGVAATIAAFKLSGNSSDDDDEYEEYEDDDDSEEE